jgi:STE24 endopeptidase
VLAILLLTPLLVLIYYAQNSWWLWAWIFFASFQLLIMWLYPVLIAPLFNKYEPVKNEELRLRITGMAEKAGFRIKGIYQVDAGKRSRHSNAFFTGLGKNKRIVLFDTLIASHTVDEIVSVLAHEIGHWKKKHIMKQLIAIEAAAGLFLFIAYLLLSWPPLYGAFGFPQGIFFVGLFLVGIVLRPILFFFTPARSAISRRYEIEADNFAFSLVGTTGFLAAALRRLARDNLSNLYPHPFFAWFYYSHPPLVSRIERLMRMDPKLDEE